MKHFKFKKILSTVLLVFMFNVSPVHSKTLTCNSTKLPSTSTEVVFFPENENKQKEEKKFEDQKSKFLNEFCLSPKKTTRKSRKKLKFSKKIILKNRRKKESNINEINSIPLILPWIVSFLLIPPTPLHPGEVVLQTEKLNTTTQVRQFFFRNKEKLLLLCSVTGIAILAINREKLALILEKIRSNIGQLLFPKEESIFEMLPQHIQEIINEGFQEKLEEIGLTEFFLQATELTDEEIRQKLIDFLGPNYPDLDKVFEEIKNMLDMLKVGKELENKKE